MKASEFRELFERAVKNTGQPDPEFKVTVNGHQLHDTKAYLTVREVTSIVATGRENLDALGGVASPTPTDKPFEYKPATIVTQPKVLMLELIV